MFRRLRFLLVFIVILAACRRNSAVPLAPIPTAVGVTTAVTPTPASRTETITLDEPTPAPQATAVSNNPNQPAPRISIRRPSGSTVTNYRPTFALNFTRPMDQTTVAAALTIIPDVPFSVDWQGNVFNITVDEPLVFDTEYQFSLDKTAVAQNGRHLARPYTWTTQLAPPLAHADWPTASDHLTPILLQFNYPIDHASFSDALQINPAISGKLSWSSDHTSVELLPDSQLPSDTAYTLTFADGLLDQDGRPLPKPENIDFTTPPAILSATPRGLTHPAGSIHIRFDRLMDVASAEAAFQIEPATNGRFQWQETTLTFIPEAGYLAENSSYTITIVPTVLSATGEAVLHDDYSWDFTTKEMEDVADFGYGPNAQILDVNGRRAVQFQAFRRNSFTFSFELYPLDIPQFLDRYESGFHGWLWREDDDDIAISLDGIEPVAEWKTVSTNPIQEWANVQEAIIPEEVPPGLYILNLVAGSVNDQLILVISQNSIAVKRAGEHLLVWVTEINGEVVPNTAVTIYARNGNAISSGQTDGDGLYETTLPPFN
ncbi:MAG: hypothetical protein GY805_07725, partial [Chloroflexi bacterium]|nr:hypothetical protein [Chloroflexota bacterium]